MVATERGLEMVLKMLSLVSVYVVFCCPGQGLLRKLTLVLGKSTNFGKSKQTLNFGPINSEFVIFKLFIHIYMYSPESVCSASSIMNLPRYCSITIFNTVVSL